MKGPSNSTNASTVEDASCSAGLEHRADIASVWRVPIQVCLLVLVLLIAFVSNVGLLIRAKKSRSKWQANAWLLRALAVVGLFNGLFITSISIANVITEEWTIGDSGCQLYALTSCLSTAFWTWLLVLSLLERYYRVVRPSEHPSLFSDVNTKIIVWGLALLLFILYLSPVYGWGEYSPYRGKLDLYLQVANFSTLETEVTTNQTKTREAIFAQYINVLYNPNPAQVGELTAFTSVVEDFYKAAIRAFVINPEEVIMSLRFPGFKQFAYFCGGYSSGMFTMKAEELLATEAVMTKLNLSSMQLQFHLKADDVKWYRQHYLEYQNSFKCGLDLTPVNENIYSFISLSWFCTLILPFILMAHLNIKIRREVLLLRRTPNSNPALDEIGNIHQQCALCFLVALFYIPHYIVNIMYGVGITTPSYVPFASSLLLYITWALPFFFHLLGTECDFGQNQYRFCGPISCLGNCCDNNSEVETIPTLDEQNKKLSMHRKLFRHVFACSHSSALRTLSSASDTSGNATTCESIL